MEPSTLALPVLINGVKALASAYDGYEKGRFMKSDQAVREEIRRRADMIRSHIERIMERHHRDGNREQRDECNSTLTSVHGISEDATMAVTGSPNSIHDGVGKLSRKGRKRIVEHDLKTLNLLVDTTRMLNLILSDDEEAPSMADVHDRIGRARNHFRERNMYIDGLEKR